jgi:hypothetical protein
MSDFFRYPHTPHLAWLGQGSPRGDKLLDAVDVAKLLADEVAVEEKVDGANLGLSVDNEGDLRVQNRGTWIRPENAHAQFRPLWKWLAARKDALVDALWPDHILFGEWCYAVHTVNYDRLPDWFMAFDVYDRSSQLFWDTTRRDALLTTVAVSSVPRLGRGHYDFARLMGLLGASRVGNGPMEGIVVRREEGGWTAGRGKLVRAEFTQAIDTHWSKNRLVLNRMGAEPAGESR